MNSEEILKTFIKDWKRKRYTYRIGSTIARGNTAAIIEAEALALTENHFYNILLAELYKTVDMNKTHEYLTKVLQVCKTETEKAFIRKKLDA